MTEDKLRQAKLLEYEINQIERFKYTCHQCWKTLRIKPFYNKKKMHIMTHYGAVGAEYEPPKELTERILAEIEKYKTELQEELENL